MALSHAYVRAAKSPVKDDEDEGEDKTLLQRVNERRRSSEDAFTTSREDAGSGSGSGSGSDDAGAEPFVHTDDEAADADADGADDAPPDDDASSDDVLPPLEALVGLDTDGGGDDDDDDDAIPTIDAAPGRFSELGDDEGGVWPASFPRGTRGANARR